MSITYGELDQVVRKHLKEIADASYAFGREDERKRVSRDQNFEMVVRETVQELAKVLNSAAQRSAENDPK